MIAVPYHLGRRDVEVGRGPLRIAEQLPPNYQIVETLDAPDPMADLNIRLADALRTHPGSPLILAGSCNLAIGVLAGLTGESPAIIWFDAHGDFNTPETSPSGRLDGMALSVVTGVCHTELRTIIGLNWRPKPHEVLLIAARDFDPGERDRLERAGVRVLQVADLAKALNGLEASTAYLHVDLDVLNPEKSPGVNCTKPGGIEPEQLYEAIALIASHLRLVAATIANYNPDRDPEEKTLKIAVKIAQHLLHTGGLT